MAPSLSISNAGEADMATEENDLDQLHTEMERLVGPGPAATLMRHLPPVTWPDVATKADIEGLQADIEGLHTDVEGLRTDFEGLRTDFEGLRVSTKADTDRLQQQIAGLNTDMQVGLAKLESSMLQKMTSQTLTTIFALVSVVIAISSVALFR
ncbi:MAG: hypothetical protein M3Z84_00130 [Actinomycetota bacterium]|nr:hypothetical protein [Actinomycetota bacterium]